MKLASKIFLVCSSVTLVLCVVGALSLWAIAHLVSVNRDITTRAVPAVRRASSVHDAMLALGRREARYLVLGDARYAALWHERASRVRDDLDRLAGLLTTPREATLLAEAGRAFDDYRRVVANEEALVRQGQRWEAQRLAETEGRALAERVTGGIEGLLDATHGAALAAQAEAARLEARTWTGVLVALGAAVALGLLGAAAIAHRLTRSIVELELATSAVAAGSFREPIRAEGADEVAGLARAFNTMAAQLRQLDELKEAFLATVSHELRSPLTSMREAAHLLRDEVPGGLNPKQARLVAIIEQSSERLLRLVNQLLDLSRLRAGMLPIERTRIELARVVARAVDELRAQAEEAGVILEVEGAGSRLVVAGDADRLVQVVVNLLANALRFTPRGGRVTVRLIDAGPEAELHVEDTGLGIPAQALGQIFNWAHRSRGGSGLGLAIVRGIVDAHGGRVTVESQEGKGSRFTVLLPRARTDG
ncbi:MAG: HAMP domain-containing protein [Candidatus Rokubacteria bacterium]|nr:HAMP domain-containing protein [Candidatus Rokubacteria bacterium]